LLSSEGSVHNGASTNDWEIEEILQMYEFILKVINKWIKKTIEDVIIRYFYWGRLADLLKKQISTL
jgi:hypothetical protein